MKEKIEYPGCSTPISVDEKGYAKCWDCVRTVQRPCGICGDPIRIAEICQDCADERDADAFTTNWGDGAWR